MSSLDEIIHALDDTGNDVSGVVTALEELKAKGGDGEFVKGAERCGDACRDVEWRVIFGEHGILGFFLDLLDWEIDVTLGRQVFRVVANSIADNDENRQRMIDHGNAVKTVLSLVRKEELYAFATATLQNLTLDNEAAQQKVIQEGGVGVLMEAIADEEADIQVPLRILELLVSHETGKQATPAPSLQTLLTLLTAPSTPIDDRLSLLTLLTTLLSHPPHQSSLLSQDLFPAFLTIFETSHALLFSQALELADRKLLFTANSALMDTIADISWHPNFLSTYPLTSPPLIRLREWLSSEEPHRYDRVIGACLVFGNVTQSRDVCRVLVHEYGMHRTLFDVVSRAAAGYADSKTELESLPREARVESAGKGGIFLSLLHSAIGVLRNFAVPKGEKEVLAADGAFNAVLRALDLEGVGIGQTWYSAAGLARMLCVDSPENCKTLVSPQEGGGTYLGKLLEMYAVAEELPTKTEIARTAVSVLRCSSSASAAGDGLVPSPYREGMARPLWDMVLQDKWAVVRSEGLLGLALLAAAGEGGREVWREWGEKEWGVVDALEGRDLENVGVMIVNFKRGPCADSLSESPRVDGLLEKCLRGRMAEVRVGDDALKGAK